MVIKKACDVASAALGTGHSVSSAAAVLDDFVRCAGLFNNGYHRMPRLKALTSTRVFTGMMIRSLLFTLLACLVSVGDLFNKEQQTALIVVLTHMLLLVRKTNLRRWNASVPESIRHIID